MHSEFDATPLTRFLAGPSVTRAAPGSEALREAFRIEVRRRLRRSDGTVSLEGRRYEIPSRFRHLQDCRLRYARWDLSRVDLVDARSGALKGSWKLPAGPARGQDSVHAVEKGFFFHDGERIWFVDWEGRAKKLV